MSVTPMPYRGESEEVWAAQARRARGALYYYSRI
jgi:hypothetical protein